MLSRGGISGGAAGLGLKSSTETYVGLIRSRSIADRLVERFKLLDVYNVKYREQARKVLESKTAVQADRSGMITIEVDDDDVVEETIELPGDQPLAAHARSRRRK